MRDSGDLEGSDPVRSYIDDTGFELKYDEINDIDPPADEEIKMLNIIDRNKIRNMEFEK